MVSQNNQLPALYQQMMGLQSMGGGQQQAPNGWMGGPPIQNQDGMLQDNNSLIKGVNHPATGQNPSNGIFNADDMMKMAMLQKVMNSNRRGDGSPGEMVKDGITNATPLLLMALKQYQQKKAANTPPTQDPYRIGTGGGLDPNGQTAQTPDNGPAPVPQPQMDTNNMTNQILQSLSGDGQQAGGNGMNAANLMAMLGKGDFLG